jgi:hypothetical protein
MFSYVHKTVHNMLVRGDYSRTAINHASLCSFFTPLKSPLLNNKFKQTISYLCRLFALSTPLIKTTKLIKLKGVI